MFDFLFVSVFCLQEVVLPAVVTEAGSRCRITGLYFSLSLPSLLCFMQSTAEMPTTPKHTKDTRESFFPVTPATLHPAPVNPDTVSPENLLRLNDLHPKSKPASSSSSSSSSASSSVPPSQESHRDTEHLRSQIAETAPSMSDLARGKSQRQNIVALSNQFAKATWWVSAWVLILSHFLITRPYSKGYTNRGFVLGHV